jgi:hypothetical protein
MICTCGFNCRADAGDLFKKIMIRVLKVPLLGVQTQEIVVNELLLKMGTAGANAVLKCGTISTTSACNDTNIFL